MQTMFFSLFLSCLVFGCIPGHGQSNRANSIDADPASHSRPVRQLSLSFDDGSVDSMHTFAWHEWNQMLLKHLEDTGVAAIFFVCGRGVDSPAGDSLLVSWNDAGHVIANHTYSHPFLNSSRVSAKWFIDDVRRNESIVKPYSGFQPFFRFPYLKEGNTASKRDSVREGLQDLGYRNGHVSIDASDWYYNDRLIKYLAAHPKAQLNTDIAGLGQLYVKHLLDRAEFYDSLAYQLEGRHIKHSLLLHHNLINALFLDDIITAFKQRGWQFIDAVTAYTDPVYMRVPDAVPAGESLIWSLAYVSGRFEKLLRYPAEDGRYEAETLDAAGF